MGGATQRVSTDRDGYASVKLTRRARAAAAHHVPRAGRRRRRPGRRGVRPRRARPATPSTTSCRSGGASCSERSSPGWRSSASPAGSPGTSTTTRAESAVKDARARVVLAGGDGRHVLQRRARRPSPRSPQAPPVIARRHGRDARVLPARPAAGPAAPFGGGVGWIDRTGIYRVSSTASAALGQSVADRSYFRSVMATDAPFVSEGISARSTKRTDRRARGAHARRARPNITGVLAGALLVKTFDLSGRIGRSRLHAASRCSTARVAPCSTVSRQPANTALARELRSARSACSRASGARRPGRPPRRLRDGLAAGLDDRHRPAARGIFAAARRGLFLELALIAAARGHRLLPDRLAARCARAARPSARARARVSAASSRTRSASRRSRPRSRRASPRRSRRPSPTALSVVALEAEDRLGLQLAAVRRLRAVRRPRARISSRRIRRPSPTSRAAAFALDDRGAAARAVSRDPRRLRRRRALAVLRPAARRRARARSVRSACSSATSAALDEKERDARRLVRRGGRRGARAGAQLRARARRRGEPAAQPAVAGSARDRRRRAARPLPGGRRGPRGRRRLVRRRAAQRRHRPHHGRRRRRPRHQRRRADGADAQRVPRVRLRPRLARRAVAPHAAAHHGRRDGDGRVPDARPVHAGAHVRLGRASAVARCCDGDAER